MTVACQGGRGQWSVLYFFGDFIGVDNDRTVKRTNNYNYSFQLKDIFAKFYGHSGRFVFKSDLMLP